MSRHTEVAEILIDIEAQLRQIGQWDRLPPSREALASSQPFCVDTLTLPQWLQFIFLPTLYQILEEGGELPGRCGIAPMAEEYFRGTELPHDDLLDALLRIDTLLTGGAR
ncbi:MAG: pseudouridine synthase [Halioglobus sp.]|nr:pseudouridine synthase [Halioglobus sp.]